jgi:hypothetical protein
MKNLITLINNTQADLLFSIANETLSALNDNAENNDRHPFVLANLECALEDLRSAESDWNSTFHPLDMDEEDRHVHGDYLGDLEREGKKR